MDNLKGYYMENTYTVLAPLQDKDPCTAFLVKNTSNGTLAVRKQVPPSQFPVYQKMTVLIHPGLARVLDLYTVNGSYYVIEEYISGETLGQIFERGDYITETQVLDYMSQLSNVLSFLHSHKIIHRDITPGNVLISTDSILKLIDFDISRTKKEGCSQDTAILGTAGFAAPEQFGFGQTDERTDIYAMGVLLNMMLTGELPGEKLPKPPFYRNIVERCTAIDPALRFQTATELSDALMRHTPPDETAFLSKDAVSSAGWIRFFPGFRTGKLWKMIIAFFGYVILIYLGYIALTSPLEKNGSRFETLTVLFWIFYVPWAVLADWGYYTKHFSIFKNASKSGIFALKGILLLLSFCGCFFFMMISMLFFR